MSGISGTEIHVIISTTFGTRSFGAASILSKEDIVDKNKHCTLEACN